MQSAHKLQPELYTVEEYLAFERAAEERHEYLDGEIRAMAGESPNHDDIGVNLAGELRHQLTAVCDLVSDKLQFVGGFPKGHCREPATN